MILEHTLNGTRRRYKVKWQAGDITWEPRSHLEGTQALHAYEASASAQVS